MRKNFFLSLLFTTSYFLLALFTLKDYGISWDETLHFSRGQAFLYYFLTGKTNYNDLPKVELQGTFGEPKNIPTPRRSFYQLGSESLDGDHFIKTIGHPPLNDDLAALSNYIFYQKLGIMDDIGSHHLFNIVASALLVFVVVFFAQEAFGVFSATISFLALCTYPLFWSESHFNIKDFPETAFFAGFIWAFFNSLNNFSIKWLALSIVFFGFALGIKFNILFAIPIILIFMLLRYGKSFFKFVFSAPKSYLILLFLAPLISLGILTLSWPLLWHDWLNNIIKVVDFYRGVGTLVNYQPASFHIFGFNTFPALWILFTTPPVTLVLFLIGLIFAFLKKEKKSPVLILWLLWFLIPVLRVTIPGSSIYGGIRQISEYIPAMALLSGFGAYQILKLFKKRRIIMLLLISVFLWPIIILFKLYPNENVYFNSLIGGLKGATERNFPSSGNSFGNTYLQGIKWLNKNAAEGAKLSLIQGAYLNAPPILLRKDIDFRPETWSGIKREGEYLMELTFSDNIKEFNYAWEYVNKFLVPVYEVKVDEIPILKIWKNDLEHTKKEYQLSEKEYFNFLPIVKDNSLLVVNLNKEVMLSRVQLSYTPVAGCYPITTSFIETSKDGINWLREKDWVPYPQVGMHSNLSGEKVDFYLPGVEASFLRFWLDNLNSCALNTPRIKVFRFE